MTADARIGLSHPGGDVGHDERRTGWRLGVAAVWRLMQRQSAPCRACMRLVEELGNAGPGDRA